MMQTSNQDEKQQQQQQEASISSRLLPQEEEDREENSSQFHYHKRSNGRGRLKLADDCQSKAESKSAKMLSSPTNYYHPPRRQQPDNRHWQHFQILTSIMVIFIASHCCLASASASTEELDGSQDRLLRLASQAAAQVVAEPMALVSGDSMAGKQQLAAANNNVILIKYANVTKQHQQQQTTTGEQNNNNNNMDFEQPYDQQQFSNQLNTFKLYEPLSVPVIESKFAHSIQLFDVSQNQLSTLSKDLFCPLSNEVRQLNISHNLLENFDCLGLISQAGQLCLSELRILDMSYNLIKHLPATGVATLHNLEILNLSNNLIESLDELALSSLFKLTKLDLSNNRIQQLPLRIFHKSTSMQALRLQSNQLQTSISQMFLSGLISLEELNLSHNNISHVSDFAFLDKVNLTRVDLSFNQLIGLRQEAIRVTSVKQPTGGYRHRLHHNGQYAGVAPKQTHSQSVSAEIFLASNPFNCDCQLEWLRKLQPSPSAIKRTVLSSSPQNNQQQYHRTHLMAASEDSMLADQAASNDQLSAQLMQLTSSNLYQNDQPTSSVILAPAPDSSNNISEIITSNNNNQAVDQAGGQQATAANRPMATLLASGGGGGASLQANSGGSVQQQQQHVSHHYARIGDLDLIKCIPVFRRNTQRNHHHSHHQQQQQQQPNYHRFNTGGQSRPLAPSDGGAHHTNSHSQQHHLTARHQQDTMIDLLSADSSNFLCRYKSHCFALCHCCEFDACDCEMICPNGCNCYYDSTWQTNIIDCSSNNHTVVPDRIPMDVSGLYLDGNNIDSLKPSNLIARKSLKTLYLNSSNLQYIANRTFNGLIELQTLYLNDNQLRSLNGYEFEPLAQLKALYLQSNRLDYISNQTFIYLRSLEILDLSNNRLASASLDLFWSIGHHNIRLRQLSIAHNWWSCQCSSINRFRQILKQKFLLNGSVNIVDKNQLRCYYNSSTVGPLILSEGSGFGLGLQQPIYASYPANNNNRQQNQHPQQTQLTEINQCSEGVIEDRPDVDVNPPLIHAQTESPLNTMPNEYSNDPYSNEDPIVQQQQQRSPSNNPYNQSPPMIDQPIYSKGFIGQQQPDILTNSGNGDSSLLNGVNSGRRLGGGVSGGMPLTSFILLSILLIGVMVIAVSIFMFVRQQQRFHQSHHKKSSAASTTSASSSASSTAISSLNGKRHHRHHIHHQQQQQHHQAAVNNNNPASHHHQHHLIMSNGSTGGATTTNINHHHLSNQHHLHHHSASSQSNIYAALVSPTTGNSTTVPSVSNLNLNGTAGSAGAAALPISNLNNLYSNSSTTASHHSSSSHGGPNGYLPPTQQQQQQQHWQSAASHQQQQQSLYNQPYHGIGENLYAINASSQASYKAGGGSLYNAPGNCHDVTQALANQQNDWIKLPKVKQFMSKLVNKSLALGGYRSCSRDELSAITSDKIYDAFISYDKRDEAFVMQHLSAELEYGQPQYRIANRFRDLPQPTSAYIAEAITSVIGCSHRTMVVLTENYLVSDWCRYELQAALRESSMDKSHKIIAIVLDPKCLLEMDNEMRSLLTNPNVSIYQQQQQQQLVQLDGQQPASDLLLSQQQLVATLTNQSSGQVSTQTAQLATSKITFINYNERKFWLKIKQLMPTPRPSTQTLTLTTKN